ncbi:MAG: 3'-5' exonuclease domain-containing protein 2 [Prolixibacteraceae bacterium]|jgi:ribonuclease D|nr:3'-5' exonuclease domain-containing protein 2 [Prolixibacteraceae bacterium]
MSEYIKEFKKTITDEELAELPLTVFEGNIHLIEKVEELTDAINYLKNHPVLGFDTETRPAFKKGQNHQVALLQLSTAHEAFLFRTNLIGLSPGLIKILGSPSIIKVGAAIRDDIKILQKIAHFKPGGFVELQELVKQYGIENFSLKKLAAIVCAMRISKSQRLTNWEAPVLTEQQQIYAATDAWISYMIYIGLTQQ